MGDIEKMTAEIERLEELGMYRLADKVREKKKRKLGGI